MSHRRTPVVALAIVAALLLAACGGGGGGTAAAHGLELPGGVESELPMPEDASIQAAVEPEEGVVSIVFSPGMTYGEARDFYVDALDGSDWTIVDESIGEADEGEVGSTWSLEGHGVEVNISLTGFGGDSATNVTGSLIVEE